MLKFCVGLNKIKKAYSNIEELIIIKSNITVTRRVYNTCNLLIVQIFFADFSLLCLCLSRLGAGMFSSRPFVSLSFRSFVTDVNRIF